MLRKLVKYEVLATRGTFLPMYLAVIVMALTGRLFYGTDIVSTIAMTMYVGLIMASVVVTVVVLVQRFYKNLLCDEGYLMHTLPVPVWKNIMAKLCGAAIWSLSTIIVVAISLVIALFDSWMLETFVDLIGVIVEGIVTPEGFEMFILVLEVCFALFTQMLATILMVHAALALGHLAKKNRIAMSVVAFFALFFVLNIIANIFGLIMTNVDMTWFNELPFALMMHMIFLPAAAFNTLLGAAWFTICEFVLSKKLNLL